MSPNRTKKKIIRRRLLWTAISGIAAFLALCGLIVPEIYSMAGSKNDTASVETLTQIVPYDAAVEEKDVISRPSVSIEVNIPAKEMTVFEDGVELFKRKVAIGQHVYPTPEHSSSIQVIEWNPWWYPPKSGWAKNQKPTPPGPKNPLGPVKLRIGKYGDILLHGTDKAWSVGRPASHGCMRMFNHDASSLAWYLQKNFSKKTDPSLLDLYKTKKGLTFRVNLDVEIPVKLVYDAVSLRDGSLRFYPDVYGKVKNKKGSIITELIDSGIDLKALDDSKIEKLSREWPDESSGIPLEDLLIDAGELDLLSAPECS